MLYAKVGANEMVAEFCVGATITPTEVEKRLSEGEPPTWAHIQILMSPVCLCLPLKDAVSYGFIKPKRGMRLSPYWLCHTTFDPFPVGVTNPSSAWDWYCSKGEGFHRWGQKNPLAERFYVVRDRIVERAIDELNGAIVLPEPKGRKKKTPKLERVANDYYPTPERYTRPLLERWQGWQNTVVCDPCAGHGHIAKLIPGCITNDFYPSPDYAPDYTLDIGRNELYQVLRDRGVQTIITNPPYGNEGPKTLLERCWETSGIENIALLLRLSFLEPCGVKNPRDKLLAELSDHMRYFMPVSPRPKFRMDADKGDNVTVAWCVWQKPFSWKAMGIESPFQFVYCPRNKRR